MRFSPGGLQHSTPLNQKLGEQKSSPLLSWCGQIGQGSACWCTPCHPGSAPAKLQQRVSADQEAGTSPASKEALPRAGSCREIQMSQNVCILAAIVEDNGNWIKSEMRCQKMAHQERRTHAHIRSDSKGGQGQEKMKCCYPVLAGKSGWCKVSAF